MKTIVRWAVENAPGMNTLMLVVLISGIASGMMLRREVFPEFNLDMILVSVPYPGASPSEVEEGVCLKIEEAVRSVSGIKKQTTVASEGSGFVILELEADVDDPQRVLNEVRSEVDRIPSFPELAEDPEIKEITFRSPAISVAVIGPETTDPDAERKLREVTEGVRNDLLQLSSVSQAELTGVRDYQIDIEISESTLRQYGLTLSDVAAAVRRENVELPGGRLTTEAQQVLLRSKNKRVTGEEIRHIPLVTDSGGVVLTIGDLGHVRDEFADITAISEVSIPDEDLFKQPGMVITVQRTSKEDLLEIADEVRAYANQKQMPAGYRLAVWRDSSVDVRDRLELLTRNGAQGLLLVFLVLALFLHLRLAFWVALGIPVSLLGCCAVLLYTGQTLNMLSMFAFLMALGIVVDDAIVIGENVFAHREQGKGFVRAAIEGTVEVIPSVTASVATTIVAFAPMLYVSGIMGKFIAVMPVAIIAMLVISLVESMIILPCHLSHEDGWFFRTMRVVLYPLRPLGDLMEWLSNHTARLLTWLIDRVYTPALRIALRAPVTAMSLAAAMLLLSFGLVSAGITPFVVFPKLDSNIIEAKVVFPDGTPSSVTEDATDQIEAALLEVNRQLGAEGKPVLKFVHHQVGDLAVGGNGPNNRKRGSHVGQLIVQLVDVVDRDVNSQAIVEKWRELAPEFPGAESVTFGAPRMGPGGTPIEFKLLAESKYVDELEQAVEETKAQLKTYPGIFDVADDSTPGKWEYQMSVKPRAQSMGVSLRDIGETVRSSYYGAEVMRLQRGRHEVKLMVRYPESDRRSLAQFNDLQVRAGDGAERPLTELTQVVPQRNVAEINRVDQMRSITVSADVEETEGNAYETVGLMKTDFMPQLLEKYPHVRVRWEGQAEQTQESMQSLAIGFGVALLVMYFLLTIEFRSYAQPAIVMIIIPFGAIGAIAGHLLLGISLSLFSIFGLVALTGVVVNDSIVLIDFINHRIRDGLPLFEAIVDAGRRRFRPVLLTSLTTVAGMTPILLEKSFQAQILIPMATSLSFGLVLATVIVLFLAPTSYYLYGKLAGLDAQDESFIPPSQSGELFIPPSAMPVGAAAGASDGNGKTDDHAPATTV